MARIRTVKPEFWTDSTLIALPIHTRLFYIGMWNFADDYGVLEDDPVRLKLQIMPADDIAAAECVEQLVDAGRVERAVAVCGTKVLVIRRFEQHQKINRRSEPRYVLTAGSLRDHGGDQDGSRQEGKGTRDDDIACEFSEWYADYPRKVGRQAAEKAYRARRRAGLTAEDLIRARENYAVSVATVESQFIKHPSTFLGPDVVEWAAAAPHAPTTVKPSTYGTPTRALLGRGVDAAPTWDLDDEGRAVPAAEVG